MVKASFECAGPRLRQAPAWLVATAVALALPFATPAWAQTAPTTGVGSQFELSFWQSVESGNDPALYEAYLAKYPDGTFATVARVKLARMRQAAVPTTAPAPAPVPTPTLVAPPAAPVVVPVSAPAPQPLAPPAQIVTAGKPAPAAASPASPRKPLATTKAALAAPAPTPAPAVRERLAGPSAAIRSGSMTTSRETAEAGPYVTAAPPTEPAATSGDSDALRRLLGALGDSQRMGAPAAAPIIDTGEEAASDTAPLTTPSTPLATPAPAPVAAPPRLVEVTGPPVAVPDAAALSASASPSTDPRPIAVGPLPPGFALPPRPQLIAVPPLVFPPSFCSADARNAFHDGSYVTAVEAAKRNNDAAIAYMHQLQQLYDANQMSGDINPMNAVAAEARAYGPVAAAAFAAQSTLVSAFSTLMAVPILSCDAPKQP